MNQLIINELLMGLNICFSSDRIKIQYVEKYCKWQVDEGDIIHLD